MSAAEESIWAPDQAVKIGENWRCQCDLPSLPCLRQAHERIIDEGIDVTRFEESPGIPSCIEIGFPIQRDLNVGLTAETLHQTFDTNGLVRHEILAAAAAEGGPTTYGEGNN
jgi:hypothetical protein